MHRPSAGTPPTCTQANQCSLSQLGSCISQAAWVQNASLTTLLQISVYKVVDFCATQHSSCGIGACHAGAASLAARSLSPSVLSNQWLLLLPCINLLVRLTLLLPSVPLYVASTGTACLPWYNVQSAARRPGGGPCWCAGGTLPRLFSGGSIAVV